MKMRSDIQVLRGIALLSVVLYHSWPSKFQLGYYGVDIFFTISGFVVTPMIIACFKDNESKLTQRRRILEFYRRRYFRLVPALAGMLIVSAILMLLLVSPDSHGLFSRQGISTLLISGNIGAFKFVGDYFANNGNSLIHTWSLSVEEQIYIFLPLIFFTLHLIVNRFKNELQLLLGLTSISFCFYAAPSLYHEVLNKFGLNVDINSISFYSPLSRLWEFTIGGVIYLSLKAHRTKKVELQKEAQIFIVGSICALLFLCPSKYSFFSGLILTCLVVFAIRFNSFLILPIFAVEIFKWLGNRSYSLYLYHMPLLYISSHSEYFLNFSPMARTISKTLALGLTIILGSLSYSHVEKKYRGTEIQKGLSLFQTSNLTIIPICVLVAILFGQGNNYWGLESRIVVPGVAWQLDQKCQRLGGGLCEYGSNRDAPHLLLIGDSHAAMLSQAVIESADKAGWNSGIWTSPSCNFVLKSLENRNQNEDCIKSNIKILNWIHLNRPSLVIVSQHIHSNDSLNELQSAITRISRHSQILIIPNTPIFTEIDFLKRMPLTKRNLEYARNVSVKGLWIGDQVASNRMVAWANNNGISTLSINSVFCSQQFCKRFTVESGWLFADHEHLSIEGAKLTEPLFYKFLTAQEFLSEPAISGQ